MARHLFNRSGGKSRLAKKIISYFPEDYSEYVYVEVFAGAGWVWLYKEPSEYEILNDKDRLLYNAWLCLQRHNEELSDLFLEQIKHECVLEEYIADLEGPVDPPDIGKALKFIIAFKLLRNSTYRPMRKPKMRLAIMKTSFLNLHDVARSLAERLDNTWLYCQDANIFVNTVLKLQAKRGRNILFFLDPVYPDTRNNYFDISTGEQLDQSWQDTRALCERIDREGHLFYLTVNETKETVSFASEYSFIVLRNLNKGAIGSEILISNYDLVKGVFA